MTDMYDPYDPYDSYDPYDAADATTPDDMISSLAGAAAWGPYDINARKGLPYGGMPTEMLVAKLERTPGGDPDAYDRYARAQIRDWGPDAPLFAGDDTGSGHGVHRLNYQYNGSHGSDGALPRHPELFLDFTDNDTPGGEPRMEDARRQATHRIRMLEGTMGVNSDSQVAESPWTQVAERHDRKWMLNRVGNARKIFTVQKTGRDPIGGAHAVTADLAAARQNVRTGGDDAQIAGGTGEVAPRGEGFRAQRNAAAAELRATASRSGRPDARFGNHGSGRNAGSVRPGRYKGGEITATAGLESNAVGWAAAGDGAAGRRRVEATRMARATAAGRNSRGDQRYGTSLMGGARKGAGAPGDTSRARNATSTPLARSAVADAGGYARDLGRRLRTQMPSDARKALGSSVAAIYAAGGADAETPDRGKVAGTMATVGSVNPVGRIRHGGATSWTANAPGMSAASSAKSSARPEGGYSAGRVAAAAGTTVVARPEASDSGSGAAAGGGAGGSGYTRGNPAVRSAVGGGGDFSGAGEGFSWGA